MNKKKVGKPYNAADARHVGFPKFGGRGAPMVVGLHSVRWGISDFLQIALQVCCGFAAVFILIF